MSEVLVPFDDVIASYDPAVDRTRAVAQATDQVLRTLAPALHL